MTADAHANHLKHLDQHLAGTTLRPDLLSKVGEAFAVSLCRVQAQLVPVTAGVVDPVKLPQALAELERLAVQIQQIARVLAGKGAWVNERVDVTQALARVATTWAAKAARLGVALNAPSGPLESEVNPAVLAQLLDLGVEYALHLGQRVDLRCSIEGNPPFPMVTFSIHRPEVVKGASDIENFNDLQWLLLDTLARATGLTLWRKAVGTQVLLMLVLPVAEESAEGAATAVFSAALHPQTSAVVGRRVLVVDDQEVVRVQAHRLLHEVGMYVDAHASIEQAMATLGDALHTQVPDVLLTSFPSDDPECRALIDILRAQQPRLRVVEVVSDESAFAFSVPGSDLPARVGRHTLDRTLVAAISQELEAAHPFLSGG